MKVALICPSNLLYMPYVDTYMNNLKEHNVKHIIINWDRFGYEKKNKYVYRDKKTGHKRSFFDYYKFSRFIKKILREEKTDKIVIFGLPLLFFFNRFLVTNYKGEYIIDIRDYNKILKIFNPAKVISKSAFTTISSPAYKEWLPISNKYIVNHNTKINNIHDLYPTKIKTSNDEIVISYIGSLAYLDENIDLINSLKNNKDFSLLFHGEGIVNESLNNYIKSNNIRNAQVYGRYNRDSEKNLYLESDIINMMLYNKNINNKTCLSNRLYNSFLYGKPLIAFSGTFLAEIIDKYKLGLVINSFNNIEKNIINYLLNFDVKEYEKCRIEFCEKVIKDNKYFAEMFHKLLGI